MSLTPNELLMWTKEQPQDSEASCRAIMSRAYYAAYHGCLEFHANLPAPGIAAQSGGVHEDICHRLLHPAPETKDELRNKSKRKGQHLRVLKHMRITADYSMQSSIGASDAGNAIAKACSLFDV